MATTITSDTIITTTINSTDVTATDVTATDVNVNGRDVHPKYRYWRYYSDGYINGHHPNISRIELIGDDGIYIPEGQIYFTADNCSDSGTIPWTNTSYTRDLGSPKSVRGFAIYSVFSGARAAKVTMYGSNDGTTFVRVFSGVAVGDGCGIEEWHCE